jgi:hypothetical protein
MPGIPNFARLGTEDDPVHVWYEKDTGSIHLSCNDRRLTDEDGGKPGFRAAFNANPRSADYNPANFNRLARFLREQGRPAPDEAPIKPRHLNRRPQVIAELTAETRAPGRPADPSVFGWSVCPACSAVVVDLDEHRAAASC